MAGIPESQARALHRQGAGLAKHKGYEPGGKKWDAAVYGTKRAGGWHPSRENRTARAVKKKRASCRAT